MKRRRLRPDELALWNEVARKTHRLDTGQVVKDAVEQPANPSPKPVKPELNFTLLTPTPRKSGAQVTQDTLRPIAERVAAAPLRMDRKTHDQMRRGKKRPEARIDLHGMTLERAHPALSGFILSAHAAGKRLVLVITGKGKARDEGGPIPVRHGVLRHQVPQWLAMAPLSQVILQVTPAHLRHGGAGAYYVYLKRN